MNMRIISLIFLMSSIILSISATKIKYYEKNDKIEYDSIPYMVNAPTFEKSYRELLEMFDGKAPYSLKRAEFLVENAFYDNTMNYDKFCHDIDSFVTISEGVAWAKMHPRALANPTPDNTLYIDASKLDFGDLSVSDFKNVGTSEPQELFSWPNTFSSITNSTLRGTVYALGKVDMKLLDLEAKTVKIMDTGRTDYDWNYGGSLKRNTALFINNVYFGINNKIHGFKTYYYGIGRLNQ